MDLMFGFKDHSSHQHDPAYAGYIYILQKANASVSVFCCGLNTVSHKRQTFSCKTHQVSFFNYYNSPRVPSGNHSGRLVVCLTGGGHLDT